MKSRKRGVFGVNCEGMMKKINFIIDKGMVIDKIKFCHIISSVLFWPTMV